MSNIEIQKRVDAFVTELSELVRQSALDAVRAALGADGKPLRPPRPLPGTQVRERVVRAVAKRDAKGGRRTPNEMAAMRAKILAYVTANPGQRIEQIADGLKVPTSELHLPARTMVGKTLRTTGERRATRYFPRVVKTASNKRAAKKPSKRRSK